MNRVSREEILIETTVLESRRGTCLRAQVGCVIAIKGRVIATGYNGSPPGKPHCIDVGCQMEEEHCIRTIHAEANAICWAARRGVSIEGGTLYTYGWKDGICHRCLKLAQSAGIAKVVQIVNAPVDHVPVLMSGTIHGCCCGFRVTIGSIAQVSSEYRERWGQLIAHLRESKYELVVLDKL